jgi:branched-chain amino acid aminotransferase
MMSETRLFAVTDGGLQRLEPARAVAGIHDLPPELPFGVYTALRTFSQNRFLALDAHLNRLEQSMALLGWSYRLDRQRLRQALHEAAMGYPADAARVRIDILAGPATLLGSSSRELITLAPFTPVTARTVEEGVRVAVAPALQRDRPLVKHADFVLARRDSLPHQPDVYEYLLVDGAGRLLEGSGSNFYGVVSGVVWTAGNGVLEGITRGIVLRLAARLDIPVRLEAPAVADADRLDEAFLSSSSRGIVPIVAIGDEPVGDGKPGVTTGRLMVAYETYVARAVEPAI